jgi:hypothetical protein
MAVERQGGTNDSPFADAIATGENATTIEQSSVEPETYTGPVTIDVFVAGRWLSLVPLQEPCDGFLKNVLDIRALISRMIQSEPDLCLERVAQFLGNGETLDPLSGPRGLSDRFGFHRLHAASSAPLLQLAWVTQVGTGGGKLGARSMKRRLEPRDFGESRQGLCGHSADTVEHPRA